MRSTAIGALLGAGAAASMFASTRLDGLPGATAFVLSWMCGILALGILADRIVDAVRRSGSRTVVRRRARRRPEVHVERCSCGRRREPRGPLLVCPDCDVVSS
ncbi:MAG: hypothetical protein R3290_10625 [Acidimicrobiia bacterium]|nr:hypothetical protein [Acidimicrobiia bacterium]